MGIVRVEPDAQLFDEWYDVYRLAHVHGREATALPFSRREIRAMLGVPLPRSEQRVYAVLDDGAVVGGGWLYLHLVDNTNRAEL
ncbi:hypothetical protein ACH5WX_10595, partial [Nocardioides sp. CER28]